MSVYVVVDRNLHPGKDIVTGMLFAHLQVPCLGTGTI